MGVASCLSVTRGVLYGQLHSGACSLSAVWNREGPLVGGYLYTSAIVISIGATVMGGSTVLTYIYFVPPEPSLETATLNKN